MSESWSPDEPLDTERYESWDEALDQEDELDPGALGGPEGERSLDRQLIVDQTEVAEAGAELDDPERLAVLDGGIDDPDGIDPPGDVEPSEDEGWDLDAGEQAERVRLDDE
jgi:hypothetical protein